jgi:hypothetical protein
VFPSALIVLALANALACMRSAWVRFLTCTCALVDFQRGRAEGVMARGLCLGCMESSAWAWCPGGNKEVPAVLHACCGASGQVNQVRRRTVRLRTSGSPSCSGMAGRATLRYHSCRRVFVCFSTLQRRAPGRRLGVLGHTGRRRWQSNATRRWPRCVLLLAVSRCESCHAVTDVRLIQALLSG